jgi:multiple sugar transport system permease protein
MTRPKIGIGSATGFMWFCMLPVIGFLLLAALIPAILAITDSLTGLSLASFLPSDEFIGLKNYRDLLGSDPKFFAALARTVIFVMLVVPIELVLGLAIALFLDREFAGRRLSLTLIMLPTMVAPVVVGMMWRFLLMPSFGPITYWLNQFGFFTSQSIFSGEISAFMALALIDIWEWTPFMMLILLSGLSALPPDPIEAAHIDGANSWEILRYVQLPLLRPLIIIAVMFRAIDASKVFDTIYVLTGGGPGSATEVISIYAFRTSFIAWKLGYGAAVCLVLAYISLVLAAAFFKVVNRPGQKVVAA